MIQSYFSFMRCIKTINIAYYERPSLILKVPMFKLKYVQYLINGESLCLYVCTSTAWRCLVLLRFTNYIGESYCFWLSPHFSLLLLFFFFHRDTFGFTGSQKLPVQSLSNFMTVHPLRMPSAGEHIWDRCPNRTTSRTKSRSFTSTPEHHDTINKKNCKNSW